MMQQPIFLVEPYKIATIIKCKLVILIFFMVLSVKFCKMLEFLNHILSVIRHKGESQNGCYKKTKHAKFSEKRTFLTL